MVLFLAALFGACTPEDAPPTGAVIPDVTLVETPVRADPAPLSEAALAKQAEILEMTGRDSLRRFARLADASDGFISNFAHSDHYGHWSLLRRTGVDPMRQIERLFELRHAERKVGDETWYIWPDFAAMKPADLLPERLDFQDRARLLELVGEEGVANIRAGEGYTGIRTAISASGRWIYYLHDTDQSEETE